MRLKLFLLSLLFVLMTLLLVSVPSRQRVFAYQVDPLPSDNLITNPWFRSSADPNESGLDGWIDAAGPNTYWSTSQKDTSPSPDILNGTAARLDAIPGQSDGQGQPGVDSYLYQTVAADPSQKHLKFDMHWVIHTIDPAEVTIYGGNSSDGPWTYLWTPFYIVEYERVQPPPGAGQDWLWQYYSDSTNLVETTLSQGYPYYNLEVHAKLIDDQSGFKFTGVYFTVTDEPPSPSPPPPVSPSPSPSSIPGDMPPQDGNVDFADYNTLLTHFGETNCQYNVTGTCLIDTFDFGLLVENFGL